jgi:hypothetical protein
MAHCVLYGLLSSTHFVRTSFSVSTHVNFLTSCIVFSPLKCIFGVSGELIGPRHSGPYHSGVFQLNIGRNHRRDELMKS